MSLPPQPPQLERTASRRHFLACGATAIAAVMACPPGIFAAPRKFVMKELSLDDLRLATFAGQLHTIFSVIDAPSGRIELKLIEASLTNTSSRQPSDGLDAHFEKFSLTFSGPKAPVLTQQIYRFEHLQIGWFAMFIVPIITQETDVQHYQAIFNRPIPAEKTLIT